MRTRAIGEHGTPFVLRHQEYWSLTAGALAGHMYGSYWIDRFDPAWQQHLSSQSVTELGYFKNFFTGINFHTLVPDQNHTLLTGGYGTYNDNNLDPSQVDYATAAKSSDGSLAVIYTPVAHTLTVAMGNFSGPVTAKWFDPTNATFPDSCRLAVPEQRKPRFHYAGKQQRWRSRLGFALAGSIRFANANPNSYRYIHADTYVDTDSDTDSHGHRHSNGYCNCNSNRNGYSNGDGNLKSQSYAYGYTNSYNNTCADSHPYRNAYSNIDTYAQRHTKA